MKQTFIARDKEQEWATTQPVSTLAKKEFCIFAARKIIFVGGGDTFHLWRDRETVFLSFVQRGVQIFPFFF